MKYRVSLTLMSRNVKIRFWMICDCRMNWHYDAMLRSLSFRLQAAPEGAETCPLPRTRTAGHPVWHGGDRGSGPGRLKAELRTLKIKDDRAVLTDRNDCDRRGTSVTCPASDADMSGGTW